MKEIIHNSWQNILSAEFEKPYYQELREFLKKNIRHKRFIRYVSFIFSVRTNPF